MDPFPLRAGPRMTFPRRPLTKAARRDIRRHVALAAEMNMHSVTLDGVVWTLHHPQLYKPKQPGDSAERKGCDAATMSTRRVRDTKRLQDFQRAVRHRLAFLFRQWKQLGRPQLPEPPLRQPPPPPLPLLPLPRPSPKASASQQQPRPQQMDDERAPKRLTRRRRGATRPRRLGRSVRSPLGSLLPLSLPPLHLPTPPRRLYPKEANLLKKSAPVMAKAPESGARPLGRRRVAPPLYQQTYRRATARSVSLSRVCACTVRGMCCLATQRRCRTTWMSSCAMRVCKTRSSPRGHTRSSEILSASGSQVSMVTAVNNAIMSYRISTIGNKKSASDALKSRS